MVETASEGYNQHRITMRIYLVRHGQSQSNADWTVNRKVADHAIELTGNGKQQARAAGEFLAKRFKSVLDFTGGFTEARIPKIRLWHSPYLRTRQTAMGIVETCRLPERKTGGYAIQMSSSTFRKRTGGESWFCDNVQEDHPVPHGREHMLLAEQQFGLFDGLSDEERAEFFPQEHRYYEKCKNFEGKMWPKMPQGESRFEVCQRVHQAFGTFHRDADRHGIKDIVVVGHGTTNRAFVTMWLHKRWEWMHNEPNPRNCSIRLIEDGEDKGYIFDGFKGGQHKGQ